MANDTINIGLLDTLIKEVDDMALETKRMLHAIGEDNSRVLALNAKNSYTFECDAVNRDCVNIDVPVYISSPTN